MIVFACGGTGGHVYPAIAVAQLFPKEEIHFLTSVSRQDRYIVPRYAFSFSEIPSSNRNPFVMIWAIFKSLWILKKKKADVVVGTGSYLTGPVVLAAWIWGIPILLMEQNVIPGRVNRRLYRLATLLCLSFKETKPYFPTDKVVVTGNPLRQTFGEDSYSRHLQTLEIPKLLKVLVFGGSQASNALNHVVLDALDNVLGEPRFWILIVGVSEFSKLKGQFPTPDGECITLENKGQLKAVILPYTENMSFLYGIADVVVCRAGASSVTELLAYQKPAVLVPYPYAKDNHQERNAQVFCDEAPGVILPQSQLKYDRLLQEIETLSKQNYAWKETTESAAEKVKAQILRLRKSTTRCDTSPIS